MNEVKPTAAELGFVKSGIQELAQLRKEWWAFLVLGILLILAGAASLSYPFFTSVGVMIFIGMTMIISGALMIVSAFWTGKWSGFFLQILAGLIYFVSGFIIADRPIASAALFTLMIAGFLIVTGGLRVVYALVERFAQWGWVLANGVISVLLGMIVLKSFKSLETMEPTGIVWIIGIIVGIELIACGFTFVMLSLAVKKIPADEMLERVELETAGDSKTIDAAKVETKSATTDSSEN